MELMEVQKIIDEINKGFRCATSTSPLLIQEPEIARGQVYSVFRGKYGAYSSVYVKKVDRNGKSGRKKHEDLAMNDIKMMQKMGRYDSFVQLLCSEASETRIHIAVSAFSQSCKEYLSDLQQGKIAQKDELDSQRLIKQLLDALSYLRYEKIVHRDIRLKHLYINRYGVEAMKWNLRVGGLKYATKVEGITVDDSGPEDLDVVLPAPGYGFQSDLFQAGFVMYCFLKKQPIHQTTGPFIPDWTGDVDYDYKQLHLKHLIKVILQSNSLDIEDILTHPFFIMSPLDLNAFIEATEWYNWEHQEMNPHMEQLKEEVFSGNWTAKLDPEIVQACTPSSPSPTFAGSFVGLWQARLNIKEVEIDVEWKFKCFDFWEKLFPAFTLHLFLRLISYSTNSMMVYELPQFRRSRFFPADPEGGFYEACASQAIYD